MKNLLFLILLAFPLILCGQPTSEEATGDELLAAQYMREGNFEKAVMLYQELYEKNPSPVIYNNYLQCLIELKEFSDARELANQQIENNRGRVRYQVDLGFVYTKEGSNRRARRHFRELIDNLPAHPPSIRDLANAFLFRDFTDYALETYQKGRERMGEAHPFHLEIASIYDQKGEYGKMMQEYVDLIVHDDSYTEEVQGLMQDAIKDDPELEKADALRRLLIRASQANPEQTIYAELLMWLSLQQNDFEMAFRQARTLDRRLQQDGELVLEVARLSASNNHFDVARRSFEYILALGEMNPYFLRAKTGMLDVKYQQAISGFEIDYDLLREVEQEYESTIDELGIHRQTVTLVRNLANLKAFYLNNVEEATRLLERIIDIRNVSSRVKGECRIELADILLLQGDLWDAHLLYAQVDKTFRDDPLGHEARFKNARLSFYMGEFNWAKAQLDVLKAATSRLIANDAMALSLLIQDNLDDDNTEPLEMYARAEKHVFMNNFNLAIHVLDSIEEKFSSHQIIDNVLMEKAGIFIRTGEYNKADEMLASITELSPNGLLAADALFERARLYEEYFEDITEAKRLYQQLITDYPGSLNTVTARNRFRYLRGDLVN